LRSGPGDVSTVQFFSILFQRIVNTAINTKEGLLREAVLTLSLSELQPHFDKAYAATQAEAHVDGFRKGKVPMNIIKSRFGKAIEQDALGDIADEMFRTAIKEQGLDVAGVPMIRSMERTEDKGCEFVIEFEVFPEFTVREYHEIEIEKPVRVIDDADVEAELRNVMLRTSTLEDAEQVTDTMHVVKLKFSEIDPETQAPLLGGKEREIFLDDDRTDPILRNDTLNLRRGDSFSYTESHAAGEHGEHAHTHNYHVTLTEIKKVVLPELTAEYIGQITGGAITTEEDLREDIKKSLQRYWDKEVAESLRDQVVDKFIAAHEFDIPKTLVAMTCSDMIEEVKKKNPEDPYLKRAKREELYETFLPNAEQSVRWQLIAEQIIKNEKLEVDDAAIQRTAESLGVDMEVVRVALEKNAQLQGRMLTDRLFEFLFERILTTEVPYLDMMENTDGQ
jgi:trigger factor